MKDFYIIFHLCCCFFLMLIFVSVTSLSWHSSSWLLSSVLLLHVFKPQKFFKFYLLLSHADRSSVISSRCNCGWVPVTMKWISTSDASCRALYTRNICKASGSSLRISGRHADHKVLKTAFFCRPYVCIFLGNLYVDRSEVFSVKVTH